MKRDRARTKILRTSPFGLIEMTRQRIRPSLKRSIFSDCPCCNGRGVVKKAESMAIEGVKIHLYGKKNTMPYRKMGHVTILSSTLECALKKADKVNQLIKVKSWIPILNLGKMNLF